MKINNMNMYSKSLKTLSEISAITGNSYNEIVGENDGLNFVWHEDNFHVHYEMHQNRINIYNYTELESVEIDRIRNMCKKENIILV